GRDLAQGMGVARAGVVVDLQATALEQRMADRFEAPWRHRPVLRGAHPYPAHDLVGIAVAAVEQRAQPRDQRLHPRPEQAAGVEILQHAMHGEQREDLLVVEPEARQLVLRPDARLLEPIATGLPVEHDRGMQPVAHVVDVPRQSRPRHLERGHQVLAGDRSALAHELVDTVVALGLVHSRAILAAPGPVASPPRPSDDPATLLAGRATTGAGVVAISLETPMNSSSNGRLAGKRAIVTGAGSGIGRASALLFASEGAQVLAVDLNAEGVEETVKMIGEAGGQALAMTADASSETDVQAYVRKAIDSFGGLEVVYANAGISGGDVPLSEQTVELWEKVLRVNL